MLGLYFVQYNYVRKDGTLKTTPAVATALTDHVWTLRVLLTNVSNILLISRLNEVILDRFGPPSKLLIGESVYVS